MNEAHQRSILAFGLWLFYSVQMNAQFSMPSEEALHEGTWLQWPHNYTYDAGAEDVEASWVAMTKALSPDERVHIIAYNAAAISHIETLLNEAEVNLAQIDFHICETDDFWVRDNGPIFVQNEEGNLVILDWGFNGWGDDAPFDSDNVVPANLGALLNTTVIDLNALVLEGGAIEIDGQGTLMATRSSITGDDRNPGLTEAEIESYLETYLGVSQIIWLDGHYGGEEDITDLHIDGFVKFANNNVLVTMDDSDLDYWYVDSDDRAIIDSAVNHEGIPYTRINLPLTQNPVHTTSGQNLGIRSSYVNYYVANGVVLVPEYADPMDSVALEIIQSLYPSRTAVGINCQNMFQWGGMVHCVTQQQPAGSLALTIDQLNLEESQKNKSQMYDLMGREIRESQSGKVYLKRYQNGEVKKFSRQK